MYAGYGGGGSSSGPIMTQQPMPHQPLQHHHPTTTTTTTDPAQLQQGHQQQQQSRRQKHALNIVDPNTGQNVLIGTSASDTTTDQLSATTTLVNTTDTHRVSHLW